MPRVRPLLIVLAVWAGIFLPALGTLEIKGEEGRRILPAVRMLETGDAAKSAREFFRSYIVPYVGSEPYLRKPPLINWLVAASFKVFGYRNEWTARMPSALCVLAVALAFLTVARKALGDAGSLSAALIWMTNFGIIEKGRLIEIEALYVSLFGLAIIFWLSWRQEGRTPWLTWVVPWIFLGLGLLAKGPLHLLFFYAIVVSVLFRAGELRQMLRPAHFAGIAIMLAIFAAWAFPYLQMMHAGHVTEVWSRQFSGRLAGDDFKLSGWILNFPRGIGYFLPWILLAPILWRARFSAPQDRAVASGLAWGVAIPFIVVNLVPGSLPRYGMPLLVPVIWLFALALAKGDLVWPRWARAAAAQPHRAITFAAFATAAALCLYAIAAVPLLQRRQKIKPIAAQIDAAIPAGERLYAVDPDYQPAFFYLRTPLIYVSRLSDLPKDARYFLVERGKNEEEASERSGALRARPIAKITDYRNKRVILFKMGEGG